MEQNYQKFIENSVKEVRQKMVDTDFHYYKPPYLPPTFVVWRKDAFKKM